MRPFEYVSAKTKIQAVELLGKRWDDSAVLAGGTDLLALMKDDIVAPKRLVNVKQAEGMNAVRFDRAGLNVGALVTVQQLADDEQVRKHYPALAFAAAEAASPQIRNLATLGGNLCQRPRCWYFRSGFGLMPMTKDGKSMVLEGDNRYHAILGNQGPAYYVHPSSIAPMLIAYGAKVRLFGAKERELPLEKFYRIPKNADDRGYDLLPNELVTAIVVPPPVQGARAAQYEVRQKEAFDWPLAQASVVLQMSGNKVQKASVVLGHVAPTPWRAAAAEQALAGQTLNEQTAQRAAEAAVQGAKSLGKNAYKIQLARVAVKRALLKAAGGAA
jgi:xanthine dehydrogenase YagS FAD-binding subunit